MLRNRCWIALGCAWLLAFFMYGSMFCIPPMLGVIKEDLGIGNMQVGLLYSTPLMMVVLLAIPSGLLADRIGVQKAAGTGSVLIGVGSLLRGASADFPALFGLTCLYGAGMAMALPNLPKLVNSWFKREYFGTATGIYATGTVSGCTIMLATTPSISKLFGSWRNAFYFWGIMALIVAALWWALIREPPSRKHLGEAPSSFGESRGRRWSYSAIWKSRNVWLVSFLLFQSNIGFYTLTGWLPDFLTLKGAAPGAAAFTASLITLVQIPSIFLISFSSDKVGLRKPFFGASTIITAIICPAFLYISRMFDWLLTAILAMTMCTMYVLCLVLPAEIVEEREFVGSATGLVLSVGYLGGFLGPWIAGYTIDLFESFAPSFYMVSIMSVIGTLAVAAIPETGRMGRSRHKTKDRK